MNKETRAYYKAQQMANQVKKHSVIDASGCVAGRLASVVAKRLLNGETIDLVNAEKAVVSGRPEAVKARYEFKATVGTRRMGPYFPRMPHLMLKRTVRSMLPYQLPNGRAAYKRLKAHIGVPPELKGKGTEVVEGARKHVPMGMTLGEVAKFLGAKFYEVKA